MERAFRQCVVRRIWQPEAEDIGVQNRLRAEPSAKRIANHTADAGARAAIRLNRGGMVMRLYFKHEVIGIIKFDDARIV